MFNFSNYPSKLKFCDNSNKLVIGKMKNETGGVAIEKFVVNFLVNNNEQKKKMA